ncbi:MAG: hypothetical protein V7K98_19055 [Nostoc sp.]|uniref:hypothetical protein n=1 Tax=Nostoc sp. TaxID=1180 RepID=UPI002FF5E465
MITLTSLDKIKEDIKQIINSIDSIANLSTGKPINLQVFEQARKSLENILSRLQFALSEAQDEENWELEDLLYESIKECEDAFNAVTSARLTQVLIRPDHDQIIADLRNIKQDIDAAIQTEKVLNFFISLARVVIRFAGV